jgi:type I restriction enzyme, S subunit
VTVATHPKTTWKKVLLGDVCEFAYGKSLPAKARSGSGFPVYGSNGEVGRHAESLTKSETIIIGRKGSFGEVHLCSEPCWPIDTTYFITSEQTDADLRWLARTLRCLRLTELNRAAAIPGLNREDAYRQPLLLPPLAEQKRIAGILDAADALRAKRRESIAQLDTLIQATFLEMFGDPFEHGDDQNHVPFSTLADRITYGFTCPMSHLESGIPILTAKNVLDGGLDLERVHYADLGEFDALTSKSKPSPGDVLITKDGSIGRCAVVPDIGPICINQSVALVIPNRKVVRPEYVAAYIRCKPVQQRIGRMGKGNALKHLQITELAKFPAVIPPLEAQSRFCERVQAIQQTQEVAKVHESDLESLFNSLQSQAFSGNLT